MITGCRQFLATNAQPAGVEARGLRATWSVELINMAHMVVNAITIAPTSPLLPRNATTSNAIKS
jgi:hypothetical protein